MSEDLEVRNSFIVIDSTCSFFSFELFIFWVWGTCPPFYVIQFLLQSLSFNDFWYLVIFLKTQVFICESRSMFAWWFGEAGDESFCCEILLQGWWCLFFIMFIDRLFSFGAFNSKVDDVKIYAKFLLGVFLLF